MLEARLIAGSRRHFETFSRAVVDVVDRESYYRAKVLEQQQRHTKYNETPYSLEPNVKESPGGLRDLHVVLWIARAAGYGTHWAELSRRGLLTAAEANIIRLSERRVKEIRARLHLVTGRREDRLVFDVQNAVALQAGLQPTGAKRASELLMQHYYRAAKVITQMNTAVLLNIEQRMLHREDEPRRRRSTQRFVARGELLDIDDEAALQRDPNAIVRAFLLKAQHQELQGMSPRLMRALWHARVTINGAYRRDPRNRATFIELLKQPKGVLHELRRMNQLSVLGRYLPVFRRIVGQMQHDLFHVYTVDQHIIQVLRNLRRFSLAEHAHEYPLCSQLIADFDRPWLLYIAALFHDIAKGRGGDHSELGARDARRFCRDHGLDRDGHRTRRIPRQAPPDDVAGRAEAGSRGRSGDPRLCRRGEVRALAGRAVPADGRRHPRHQPQGVERVEGQADRGPVPFDPSAAGRRHRVASAVLEGRKQEALHILRLYGLSDDARNELWGQFDVVYFLRHSAQDIAWHTRSLFSRVNTEKPVVRARLARIGEGAEVLIYVKDQKDLFARVCGYFDSRNLSILDARIHTTRHGYALDTFLVDRQWPRAPLPRAAEPGRTRTRAVDRHGSTSCRRRSKAACHGSRATSRSRPACTCCRTSAGCTTC